MKQPLPTLILMIAALGPWTPGLMAADPNGKASENRIYAQTLVNTLITQRSDLLIIGLHGVVPGSKDEVMIACNLDHIGNPDTELDKAAGQEHMTLLEPKTPEKFEMTLPLMDASGGYVGAVVMIFKRAPGESELALYRKGLGIRDGLAKQIPTFAALLAPAN